MGFTVFCVTLRAHFPVQINKAAEVIYERMDPNANIIFGALVDESMHGQVAITVIATGFDTEDAIARTPVDKKPKMRE